VLVLASPEQAQAQVLSTVFFASLLVVLTFCLPDPPWKVSLPLWVTVLSKPEPTAPPLVEWLSQPASPMVTVCQSLVRVAPCKAFGVWGVWLGMDGFKTSDLYFAAYLRVAGAPLVGTERDGRRVIFFFEDQGPIAMRQLKRQYFSDSAKVHVLSFVQAVKHMKGLTVSDSEPIPDK
jgi:hypothetical protein